MFLFLTLRQCNTEAWLSIYAGLFTGFFTIFILQAYDKVRLFNSLNHLSGNDWRGWAIKERKLVPLETEKPVVQFNSEASIKYIGDNLLSISVKHRTSGVDQSTREWKGTIEMNRQYLNKGSVTGKYVDVQEIRNCDLFVYKDKNSIFIYLIPFNNTLYSIKKESESNFSARYDYGTEVFERKLKNE